MVGKKDFFLGLTMLVLTLALLTGFVLSQEKVSKDRTLELQSSYNNVKCKADFSINIISSYNSLIPSGILKSPSDKLNSDLVQLKTYADGGDLEGFKNYIKTNFKDDFNAAKNVVVDWRKNNLKTFTAEKRRTIRDSYSQQKATFDSCHLKSLKNYGDGRVTAFNAILDSHQKRADKLKEKGFDTSSLSKIIQDAKLQIVDPLKSALAAAKNLKEVHESVKKYCLFDGCKEGINFHLQAKFEIGKLDIALTRLKGDSGVSADKISKLENYIIDAKTALNSVGTSAYTDDSRTQVWDNIKSAYNQIKEIRKTLKGE